MNSRLLARLATIILALGTVAGFLASSTVAASGREKQIKVLIFTGGQVHDGKGIGAVLEIALRNAGHFEVTRVEEDLDTFIAPKLDPFDVIVFQYTLGEIQEAPKRGLMNAVAAWKGLVGIHSACDSFRGDPDWRALWGAHFRTHPAYQQFQVSVTKDHKCSITQSLDRFFITDEQYILDFDSIVRVLANGLWNCQLMPAIWTKPWGKGKVYYMSFGHDPKACEQEVFRNLLVRAVQWAGGAGED